ncbi:hypothetical protein CEXT_515581 [Caerostris extrusa]|uniref:Uncharacterized protein n=1 Tax=Caerostris extrusa TaxID=172846 RepID=A0AAV4VJ93_CAEEX|nr:hypothetical protein CEXT_515581 [Caerostris extrusa]
MLNLTLIQKHLIGFLEYKRIIGLVSDCNVNHNRQPRYRAELSRDDVFYHRVTDSGTPYGPSIPARPIFSPKGSQYDRAVERSPLHGKDFQSLATCRDCPGHYWDEPKTACLLPALTTTLKERFYTHTQKCTPFVVLRTDLDSCTSMDYTKIYPITCAIRTHGGFQELSAANDGGLYYSSHIDFAKRPVVYVGRDTVDLAAIKFGPKDFGQIPSSVFRGQLGEIDFQTKPRPSFRKVALRSRPSPKSRVGAHPLLLVSIAVGLLPLKRSYALRLPALGWISSR